MWRQAGAVLALIGVVALLGWASDITLRELTDTWFERDSALRAQLAVTSANSVLADRLSAGDQEGLRRTLIDIASDERVFAVAACGDGGAPLASTWLFPATIRCDDPRLPVSDPEKGSSPTATPTSDVRQFGPYHVSSVAVRAGGTAIGKIVFVHDMRFAALRIAQIRSLVFGVLAAFAATYIVFSMLFGRLTRRSWIQQLSRVLGLRGDVANFRPLLQDLRTMRARLEADRDASTAERAWTPSRLRDLVHDDLDGAQVIVLANREPVMHERDEDGSVHMIRPASGLVTALEPVIRACAGTWVAHGSGSADRSFVDRNDRLTVPPHETPFTLRRVWLSEKEERGYYYGFANEGLWPLCHLAHTRPQFRSSDFEYYRAVNARFADAVVAESRTDAPVVLVQDYHFALAPKMLRERLPRATIVVFWHIPWPTAESFGICPWRNELLEGMLGASIVGFHTQQHSNNFLDGVDAYLEARIDRERRAVIRGGQQSLVRQYPISVEWPTPAAARAPEVSVCRAVVRQLHGIADGTMIGLGVDRLDYTKGIEERFLAVERLLDRFPTYRGRFTFVQLAAPSRTDIPRYQELAASVGALARRINARYGRPGYVPIVLRCEHHDHDSVLTHYRGADVCYVSSLHDGMNLVAKEFVAARDDERGVLVLSHFTGSARELTEALIVNPYDIDQAADALARALAMDGQEVRERMHALRAHVREWNVLRWAGRLLIDASRERHRAQLTDRLGNAGTLAVAS